MTKHEPTVKPWERQTWDTAKSHDAFHKYYLPQPQPRSIDLAYRVYLAEQDGHAVKEDWVIPDDYKSKRANGTWRGWAHALNKKGAIDGAMKWADRAAAFDDFIKAQAEALWLARELEVRESDWTTSIELRKAGLEILKEVDKFTRTSSRVVPGDAKAGIPDREVITLKLNSGEGIKMLDLASKLGRLAANVEQPAQRIIAEIDKEIDYVLAIIEQVVDEDTYNSILKALQAGGENSPATAEGQ